MSKQKPNGLNASAILSGLDGPQTLFDSDGLPVVHGPAQMLDVPSLEERALFAKSNETNRKVMLAKNWLRQNALDIAQAFIKRRFLDSLVLYKALPPALAFHRSGAHNRLLVGSNKSGKTVSAGFEAASKVLGRHPRRPKQNGWLLCVGLDEDHISHMWGDILTKEGLFQIVPDEITGAPRAVRPDPNDPRHIDPIDLDRQDLWQPSPPFIPQDQWDWPGGIVWRDKGKNAPAIVRIKSTGWKMTFHPSGGVPKRGIAITDAWFDEEIANMLWITETIPRLVKDDGYFVWSATPQTASEELVKMHARVLRGDDDIEEFTLYLEDNPYISDAAKKRMYDSIAAYGDEELAVRYFGEWAVYGRKIYPQWDMNKLGTDEWTA